MHFVVTKNINMAGNSTHSSEVISWEFDRLPG